MKANPKLVAAWQAAADAPQQLIVRVSFSMGMAERALGERGIQVRRRCKLINGLMITCTGKQAQDLTLESWVLALEPDLPVSACLSDA